MIDNITGAAMDTHKKEHIVALHYPGQQEIVSLTVKNTSSDILKMVRTIFRKAPGERIKTDQYQTDS